MMTMVFVLTMLFSVPDESGTTHTVDLEDVRNLQFPSDDHHFVVTCPYGNPSRIVLQYSETGEEFERLPPEEPVLLLLRIDGGKVLEIEAATLPDGNEMLVVGWESGKLFDRLLKARTVGVEVEHGGQDYGSFHYSAENSGTGTAGFQMLPCDRKTN